MKSFERLVLSHLKDITDPLLDPMQFAYRANRSVDDAVNMALHFILQHLDSPGSYARILFVDFSSAFNTIVPSLLRDKLSQLNVPDSLCRWITDFLTDRRQFVRLEKYVSDSRIISTGSPQGCVLSPLLFSLYTNSCTSGHQSVKLLKFADDTTLIGLISDGDESAYRREMDRLVSWWNGGVATIEECPDEDVWGVVWKMAVEDITSLDKQESVDKGVYSPMEVTVETETGPLLCRTYKMNNFRPCAPSPQYKEVICLGAQQNGLPEDYIKKLQAVETNNYTGPSILDEIKKHRN
ncbi:hypothetical protein PGIGA_G00139710 [Pangasianodon gigas]|uniref:Uncharacterized protein n=1 Tax=Pangasianodon gigas TaxID=30993 RepID=A0ACC5XLT1_PANGG|nr:hypothetical protein [Pangasianodon gigas]